MREAPKQPGGKARQPHPAEIGNRAAPPDRRHVAIVAVAERLRRFALEACKRSEFGPCLEQLDRARDLDPEGDSTPEVTEARQGAKKALEKEKQAPQNVGPTNDGPTSDGPTSDGPTSNDTDNAPKGKTQVQTKSNELAPPVKPAPSVSPNQNGTPFPTPTFNPTKGGTPKGKPSAPKKESSLGSKPGASDSAPGSGIDLGSEPASSPPMPQQAPSPQMQQQPFSGQGKK